MDICQLNIAIGAFANALSCRLTTDEINLLGAILSQLGDTLDTIATQRAICEKNRSAADQSQSGDGKQGKKSNGRFC